MLIIWFSGVPITELQNKMYFMGDGFDAGDKLMFATRMA
jgi:hypothetical protein